MPDGDEHRLHAALGAQRPADDVAVQGQRGPVAALLAGWFVAAHRGLADADARQVGQHTQVAGQAEAARVRQALAVAHQRVRSHRQPVERVQQRWCLAEREQARHVGEPGLAPHHGTVHHGQRRHVQDGHHRDQVVPVAVRHVQTRRRADLRWFLDADLRAQALLDRDGVGLRRRPRVQVAGHAADRSRECENRLEPASALTTRSLPRWIDVVPRNSAMPGPARCRTARRRRTRRPGRTGHR